MSYFFAVSPLLLCHLSARLTPLHDLVRLLGMLDTVLTVSVTENVSDYSPRKLSINLSISMRPRFNVATYLQRFCNWSQ
jgi:hypothetical protein